MKDVRSKIPYANGDFNHLQKAWKSSDIGLRTKLRCVNNEDILK
jgi:hypothetical protein